MKLALVHDWLNQVGGAEDVLATLLQIWPESPVYASIHDPDSMPADINSADIRTLWLDRLPGIHRHHQPFLPLYPLAWSGLHLREYDVILSNKSGFCTALRHDEQTLHICYCLTPTRFLWQLEEYIKRERLGVALRHALRPLVALLRRQDYASAQRVHHFIAISSAVRQRIRDCYERDSALIFPPVDTQRFRPVLRCEDYFLTVARLVPYKRIDLAVRAATRLNLPLKVGGTGRDLDRLRAMAGPTVEFLGYVPDDKLPELMARCRAFLFPGHEDFGITPVQAQAAGRPVIAFSAGGALDTVIPGLSGELFHEQSVDALTSVLANLDSSRYDSQAIRAHALRFDSAVFRRKIRAFVSQALTAFRRQEPMAWRDPYESG
ncbi:MAG: glycosyltransferase [Anaerolineae bacterium]|nr:glycosyltransferase [Anaerolineae bacterium]